MKHLSKLNSLLIAVIVASVSFFVTGCGDDDNGGPMVENKNVVDLIRDRPELSTLLTAVNAANLANTLSGTGPFTIFAPTNAAFNALPAGAFDALVGNPTELARVLQHHVVGQRLSSSQLSSGMLGTLLPEFPLTLEVAGGMVRINDVASVTTANLEGTNGYVHIIDAVLIPTEVELPSIVDIATGDDDFSTLVAALTKFPEILTALEGEGPFTVFAPNNAAFERFIEEDNRFASLDDISDEILEEVLRYHVIAGAEVFSNNITAGDQETLQGESITITINGTTVTLNGTTTVIAADVDASNGVVHVIDNVLLPPSLQQPTIAAIAGDTDELSILVQILTMEGFEDLLAAASDPSASITVFAPTNAAFLALLETLGKEELTDLPMDVLKEIVSYHILGTEAFSGDLMAQQYPTLLDGESVTVDLSDGVKIDDATVVMADVAAANGVVHVVDAVLLPSVYKAAVGTIVEVPLFTPEFSVLVAALKEADLVTTLIEAEAVTIFAPDNDAFAAAGITSLDGLNAEALTPILLYHVVGGKVLAGDLAGITNGIVTTLSENKFFLSLGDDVFINGDVQVTGTDIEKGNGVIHTISKTLMPPTQSVVEIAVALSEAEDAEFTTLVGILTSEPQAAVLSVISDEDGNFTIFAPTDAAFAAISEVLPTLTDAQVSSVLTYHVVAGDRPFFSTDLTNGMVVPTANSGQSLTVNISGDGVTLTDSTTTPANVILVNVLGTNGVIHAVDKVLLPTL